jgi:hypothetical protein
MTLSDHRAAKPQFPPLGPLSGKKRLGDATLTADIAKVRTTAADNLHVCIPDTDMDPPMK